MEEEILEKAKKKMVLDHLVIQRMDTTGRTVLNKGALGPQNASVVPFNVDELNAILRFGAEELFSKDEDEDDSELQVDIDDILRMAETRNTEDLRNSTTDELLSQFKVVSFDNLEDEELEGREHHHPLVDKGKFWDKIIPESERKKIEEEELHQQLLVLNPPPRSRKNVVKAGTESNPGRGTPRKRRYESNEDESESDSVKQSRKRGRPRAYSKEQLEGFTGAELRLLVKSIKKFPRPREHLDAIAADAKLHEKPKAQLSSLVDLVLTTCAQTMAAYNEDATKDSVDQVHKSLPTFKLSKMTVNAKSLLQAINELEPLAIWMDCGGGKVFPDGMHVKDSNFDCNWTVDDDVSLLRGVFEHGIGGWETIKLDPQYKLEKILPENVDAKPQAKHLQIRVDYLLRGLLRHAAKLLKRKHGKKSSGRLTKVKDVEAGTSILVVEKSEKAAAAGTQGVAATETAATTEAVTSTTCSSVRKKSKKKRSSEKQGGETKSTMAQHFTTHETQDISNLEPELPPEIFAQVCLHLSLLLSILWSISACIFIIIIID